VHKKTLATLAILIAGVALAAPASANAPARVVYGYPYTDRCPGAGLADIVDRWGMYACNCTSYVAWALLANHQRIDWFIRGSMDAWNWPNVARMAELVVDRTPTPGAVAVWPQLARPFGHIAYVTSVGPNRTIDVAEYNFPGPNGTKTWGFETRSFVRSGGALFIHVPRRDDEPHR
jgi:surface antigen